MRESGFFEFLHPEASDMVANIACWINAAMSGNALNRK